MADAGYSSRTRNLEQWTMVPPKPKKSRAEELPLPQSSDEPDTLSPEQSSTSIIVGAVVVLVSLFLGFQWNDFAVLSLTTQNTSMIELESEDWHQSLGPTSKATHYGWSIDGRRALVG